MCATPAGTIDDLVRRVAEDSGRTARDVDVLRAPHSGPYRSDVRVDVGARKLVSVGRDREKDVAPPGQLGRP